MPEISLRSEITRKTLITNLTEQIRDYLAKAGYEVLGFEVLRNPITVPEEVFDEIDSLVSS